MLVNISDRLYFNFFFVLNTMSSYTLFSSCMHPFSNILVIYVINTYFSESRDEVVKTFTSATSIGK